LVELPPPVVGDDEAVGPEGEGEFRVLGVDHPFDDQVTLPLVADGADAGWGEPPAEGFVHEEAEVLHGKTGGNVGLEGGKLRDAGKQLGEGPLRPGAHLENVPEAHLWRDGEAVADFLGAVAEGGGVGEEDEGFAAGVGTTAQELVAERIFGGVVELEPEVASGDFGDGLDAGRGDGAEDEGQVVGAGGAGEDFAGFRPHQGLQADGGDAERVIIFPAKEGGFQGSAPVVAQVGGAELDGADIAGVFAQVDLGHAATGEVVVSETGHALPGAFGEEFDGRVAGVHDG